MNEIFDALQENLNADSMENLLKIKIALEENNDKIIELENKIEECENTILCKSSEIAKYEKILATYIKESSTTKPENSEKVVNYDELI